MTADEFVRALKQAAKKHTSTAPENPFLKDREVAIRAWSSIKKRRRKTQADTVLDLIARYDLSGVVVHQFTFVPEGQADGDRLWLVATQPTYEYTSGTGWSWSCTTRSPTPTRQGSRPRSSSR